MSITTTFQLEDWIPPDQPENQRLRELADREVRP